MSTIHKHVWAMASTALLSLLGIGAASAAEPQRQFGVIEIGGSGVKATIVEFVTPPRDSIASGLDLKVVRRFPIKNVDPAFAENVPKVAAAIDALIADLKARYDLDPLHIYITAASGLNMDGKGTALRLAVDAAAAGRAGALSFVSPAEQAQFGFNGVVNCQRLAHRRQQTLFIDVGSSEIVAAAAGPRTGACGSESISALTFGFGVKTGARLLGQQGGALDAPADTVDAMVKHVLEASPPRALSRERVYWGGGIVWTVATMLHPEDGSGYVRLQPDDFARIGAQLRADAACLTDPVMALRADPECGIVDVNFSAVRDVDQRVRVAADHREIVTSIYTREQLMAGIEILLALIKQLDLTNSEVFFARPSLNAWTMGYLLAQENGLELGHPISPAQP